MLPWHMNNLHAPEVGDQVEEVTRVDLEVPVPRLATVSMQEDCLWDSVSLILMPKLMVCSSLCVLTACMASTLFSAFKSLSGKVACNRSLLHLQSTWKLMQGTGVCKLADFAGIRHSLNHCTQVLWSGSNREAAKDCLRNAL